MAKTDLTKLWAGAKRVGLTEHRKLALKIERDVIDVGEHLFLFWERIMERVWNHWVIEAGDPPTKTRDWEKVLGIINAMQAPEALFGASDHIVNENLIPIDVLRVVTKLKELELWDDATSQRIVPIEFVNGVARQKQS